ncbi:PA2169 family four-helix-bundle protein [Marivirga sp. S37H4]|uniref:PA2169 family four-helix-bundle protein n=1 Tax=Marivirga aurantiaca TaxID=2802615 RepID=A0A934WVY9_9BACT|nr:PA2169 family four-helix-bundle protein [Marivirga aurantiaca]MBK6264063.1 PA2169 family four-helix-bundle protein [Marivirga aurantiaca]
MKNSNQTTINYLNKLISIIEMGKESYQQAAEKVLDPRLKEEILKIYQEKHEFSVQLQQEVIKLNGVPKKDINQVEALRILGPDLKSALTSGDRFAVMNVCISVEEIAIEEYKNTLENQEFPLRIKEVITQQLDGIERAFLFMATQFV